MKRSMEKKYEHLSPFELKNKLIEMAESDHERMMLNAGRGNPNWLAVTPRAGFFLFGQFALQEAERVYIRPGFAKSPEKKNIAKRFKVFLAKHSKKEGASFLKQAFFYVTRGLKMNADEFVFEMTDAILADHYPTPDRMLSCCEKIVRRYLIQEMCKDKKGFEKMDLFATEGGTAAMTYVFNTLMENKLLHKGDKIALGSPIFTPYLEIPRLNDFNFVELEIKQDENNHWQYSDCEIKKLENPKVKAFFLVHPSNPTSVAIHEKTLQKIAALVKKRKDLILLTDDVYGTFVNKFQSLIAIAPKNTILVYSFSKYFGATGWRLGVIGINHQNAFDKKIAKLSGQDKKALYKRYESVVIDPNKMKLIDRMVADSRTVALNHTAGLSTPQQVMMTFFSLFGLLDKKNDYKKKAQDIVHKRIRTLYQSLKIDLKETLYDANYYTTIDIPKVAEEHYGKAFKDFLIKHEPIDFVIRLAKEKGVVLLDGGGFDAPKMSIRVSLANLTDEAYANIGKKVRELLLDYYKTFKKNKNDLD